ncbi:unnamed protein product [Adineta ricciae]|uniref:Uncharacterized protein n=1 Tax=Adineta ricciae TaxID=249248 RepID=A0A814TBL5_ADIRI|nr:unnamed protein product [Adineta ricciae]
MSTSDQQSQALNKKQRRKLARAHIAQPTQQSDTGHEIIDVKQTDNNHVQPELSVPLNIVSIPKGNSDDDIKPIEDTILTTPPTSDIDTSRSIPTIVPIDIEKINDICNEDLESCSPNQTPRRRNKRFPITSAIPLLPSIEQKHGPPANPSPGKIGTPIEAYTNHFPVQVAPNIMLYQYDAVVEKLSFQSLSKWEEKLSQHQFPRVYTLPANNQNKLRFSIQNLAGQWATSTIFDYISAPDKNVPMCAIRILETLLKQALLPVTHCEGSLFYRDRPEPDKSLPDGFELRLGFFQALYLTQAGLTLNLQTTLTKFYPDMEIIDFLSVNLRKDIRKYGMISNDYEKARLVLNGCKITTRQSNYTQIYQIRSFSDIPERQTFTFVKETVDKGRPTSTTTQYNLIQYYEKEKNIKIDYPKLRCLRCFFLHERNDPKDLPMELCRILQWQECERESASEQRDRQNHTIPSPDQRYKDIMSSLRSCNYASPPKLPLCKAVQLSVDDREMKLIKARVLPPPVINNNHADINMGRINLRGRFFEPYKLKSVAFVYFGRLPLTAQKKSLMDKFVVSFQKIADLFRLGPIQTGKKDVVSISENEADRELNFNNIETCFNIRKQQKCELIVCIMDSNWNELRPTIKLKGTVHHGITTQCLMYCKLDEQMERFARTQRGSADRVLDNMCENLLRKINFKMQGTNTKVSLPITIASNNTTSAKSKAIDDAWQFMGADVIHPVCRQDKPSIAAVVGSGDSLCSTSAVRICKQWPRSGKCAIEAIVDLQQMVAELLEYYRGGNKNRLPNKIVFYRDGVDDGQFARVLNFEIPQLKEAFREVYQNEPLPLLTFIVVKKRHHTRFFTLDNRNQTANIPPGFVVDTDIVHPGQFSFFLNSHKALQGTNRPALYHVLYDEIKFTADELQLLTYYLCFTDPRSSMSEAIPSLVHQADLAASNARDLFADRDNSTTDGYAADALENPSLGDIVTEHLCVHEDMRDRPHFG